MRHQNFAEQDELRECLYQQGLSDWQIAEAVGCSRSAAASWRCRKGWPAHFVSRKGSSYVRVHVARATYRMEDCLTPDECDRMRAFIRLLNFAKQHNVTDLDRIFEGWFWLVHGKPYAALGQWETGKRGRKGRAMNEAGKQG